MVKLSAYKNATVKIYHGYGHTHDLIIFGHVFMNKIAKRDRYSDNILRNIIHLLRLFIVQPIGGAKVQLEWRDQLLEATTEADGFFKFEWKSDTEVEAGWHGLSAHCMMPDGSIAATGLGQVYVPHVTQYAFISDIDDTVLISHSAKTLKKIRTLFTKNPHTRKTFEEVVENYQLLARAHTETAVPNPFFYVSNSEWNLYDDLVDFFEHNGLPGGSFLLNHLKRWYQIFRTGESALDTKLRRAIRIMNTFPKQRFVLLGDNSQKDPEIYASVVNKFPERVFAVYIRNINSQNESNTARMMKEMTVYGTHTCFFKLNTEAIQHAKEINLIQ